MWKELSSYIDDDERLVFPEAYLKNRELYDKIRDVVWFIKPVGYPNAKLQFVTELALPNVLKNYHVDVLGKALIVRLRLPWREARQEWLCSQEELNANREYYQVLDTYITVRRKGSPKEIPLFNILDFEENRDKYDVVDVKYLVTLRLSKEVTARLLGIDPDSIHTYISE